MGDVIDFPLVEKGFYSEEEEEWFAIYVCFCESPFFYATPDGMRCANPECGEYLNLDNYEE